MVGWIVCSSHVTGSPHMQRSSRQTCRAWSASDHKRISDSHAWQPNKIKWSSHLNYIHILYIYIHVDHISIKPTTYLNIDAKNLAHSNSNSEILRLLIDIALGIVCGLAGGFWVKCHGYTAGRLKRWRLRESEPEAPTGPTGPRRVAGWSPTMWGPQTW